MGGFQVRKQNDQMSFITKIKEKKHYTYTNLEQIELGGIKNSSAPHLPIPNRVCWPWPGSTAVFPFNC